MSQENDERSEFQDGKPWPVQWFHVPVVVALVAFAFWVRARNWGEFVRNGEILFSGNDAWYHYRQVEYVTKNFPETMPFEAWTNFPTGTSVSQFGTIFDQSIAVVALIVGLGDPSGETIKMVLLFAPAAIGALIVVPTFYLGKRIGRNRIAGLIAALIVVLSTGGLFRRSIAGFSDHHVGEAFTQAIAVLAIVVAIQVADREKPVWELFEERSVETLRRPVGYGILGGFGAALYMWVWPPGVLIIGILGLYVTIQATVNHLRGESPEHVSIVVAIIFLVSAVLMLLPLDSVSISPVKFSLLQPGLAIAGAIWCGILSVVSRRLDELSYPKWTYPTAIGGILLAGVISIALVAPDTFGLLSNQLTRVFGRLYGEQPSAAAATVGEVDPLREPRETLINYYGFTHFFALAGILLAVARQYFSEKARSELLLVSLWLIVVFSATYTQQRFSYYLTVPVAIMAAYVFGAVIQFVMGVSESTSELEIQPYQIMAVFMVLILIIFPMTWIAVGDQRQDVVTQSNADRVGPGGVIGWQDSLNWMADNTPAQGTYAGSSNSLDYWGEFAKTNDFEYADGTYGVLSWWDYGHWLTAQGKQIPVANPFQESASDAARFLLAQNESQAEFEIKNNMSDGDASETRYVVVDWKMARTHTARQFGGGGKFFAPPAFIDGVNTSDYYYEVYAGDSQTGFSGTYYTVHKQAYYETMVNRLYRFHGSAREPQPFVTEVGPELTLETRSGREFTRNIVPQAENSTAVRFFSPMEGGLEAAKEYANESEARQVGGLGPYPSKRVPALEHYRLVKVSDVSGGPWNAMQPGLASILNSGTQISGITSQRQLRLFQEQNPQWTKVFERVPGGTIEGQGPANKQVHAAVEMKMPTSNQTFLYRQQVTTDDEGHFSMTVPYSSTGAENWGPEHGYTNTSVRAASQYEVFTDRERETVDGTRITTVWNDTVDVTEGQVIGENDSVSTVELTETVLSEQDLNDSEDDTTGNETDDTTPGNETDDSTAGNETEDTTSNNETNSTELIADPVSPEFEPAALGAPIAR